MAVKAGFEPAVPLSEYVGLANRWFQPLTHFTRKIADYLVGVVGFEPTAPCSQSRCANRTALHPEEVLFLKSDAKVVL